MPVIANWTTNMHYNNIAILIVSLLSQRVTLQLGLRLLVKKMIPLEVGPNPTIYPRTYPVVVFLLADPFSSLY